MLDDLLEIVTNWFEIKGYETVIDYEDDILYYENEDGERIQFCVIDESVLQKKIELHNMNEFKIIE